MKSPWFRLESSGKRSLLLRQPSLWRHASRVSLESAVERIQTGSYHMGYTERDVFRVCMTQLTVRNYPSDLHGFGALFTDLTVCIVTFRF